MKNSVKKEVNEKLCKTWLLLSVLIKGYGTQFDIATENKIGGKFDDIVLRYNKDLNSDNFRYIFCHINNNILNGKKETFAFNNLSDYFLSYLRIEDQLKGCDSETTERIFRLILYTNVSNQEGLVEKEHDEFSQILSLTNTKTSFYLDTDSTDVKKIIDKIIEKLVKVRTDWQRLVLLLGSYTKEKYTEAMKDEDPLNCYQAALVGEGILQVKYEKKGPKCSFNYDFLERKFKTDGAKQLYKGLLQKTELSESEFKEKLINKSWKIWPKFGEVENGIKLPSIEQPTKKDVLNFFKILEIQNGVVNCNKLLKSPNRNQVEINKLFNLMSADYIIDTTDYNIRQWQKNSWITHKDMFFDAFKKNISKIGANQISDYHIKQLESIIHKYNVGFKNKLLYEANLPSLTVIYSEDVFFSALKVYENLSKTTVQFLFFNGADLKHFSKYTEILSLLSEQDSANNTIVINWETEGFADRNIYDVVKKIRPLVTSIIVITNSKEIILDDSLQIEDNHISIEDFQNQEKILDIEVCCQGTNVSIKDLMKEVEISESLTPDVLKKLFLGKRQFWDFKENQSSIIDDYITRKILPMGFNESFLMVMVNDASGDNEIFAISGETYKLTEKHWFQDHQEKFVILQNENIEQQLEYVHLEKVQMNIHWITYNSNHFIWKKTLGSDAFWWKNMKTSKWVDYFNVSEGNLKTNYLQIITGDAGLGKTTLLNKMQTLYADQHPTLIVKRINLNDHQKTLSNAVEQHNMDPMSLFCKLLTTENAFQKKLIQYAMKKLDGVLLLFDGYDEIESKSSRSLLKQCLHHLLKEMKKVDIIITSRTSLVSELFELDTCVLAVTLQDFTKENQKVFLKNRFSKKFADESTEENYVDFALKLLQKDDYLFTLFLKPLFLEMLSEHLISTYQKATSSNVLEGLDLFNLIKLCTQKLYERYFVEKEKIDPKHLDGSLRQEYEKFISDHQILAVNAILQNTNDIFPEILGQEISDDYKNVYIHGIAIVSIINDDVTKFIHPTFAEYFCALFLFNKYFLPKSTATSKCSVHSDNVQPEVQPFLNRVLNKNDYPNVRPFLESLSATQNLPVNVM